MESVAAVEPARVEVRELSARHRSAAVGVLARAMQDNPVIMAVYGRNADRRRREYGRLIHTLLAVTPTIPLLGAFDGDTLLAVAASAPPGTCQPSLAARARLMATVAGSGPAAAARVVTWTSRWGRRDLEVPHVHLGPGAVDDGLRGQGLGSALLRAHCGRLDAARAVAYLETDRAEAVAWYRRFGFETVGQVQVLGVPTWLMRRSPTRTRRSQSGGQ